MKNLYTSSLQNKNYDAIIIGSGLGGLATAVFLAKAGKKVIVLEKHYSPGGFTHTFRRKDFEWDVGVHYVGQVHNQNNLLYKAFEYITEGKLQWKGMGDVYDKAIIGEKTYEFVSGRKRQIEKMVAYFPSEESAIRKYYDAVTSISTSSVMFFSERTMPHWLSSLAGGLLRKKFLKYSAMTTSEFLHTLTSNEELIAILCAQCGNYGLPPAKSSFAVHAMIIDHFLEGGNYPVGGASRIHTTITDVLEKYNGILAINAPVKSILLNNDKAAGVEMENGDKLFAPIVISNAGAVNTFGKLLPNSSETAAAAEDIAAINPSVGHACLYVGLSASDQELSLPKNNYWLYDNEFIDESFENHLKDPLSKSPLTYISFPSAKDPEWPARHPGKATIQVICSLPYEWVAEWKDKQWKKRGEEYESIKTKISNHLLDQLYRVVPQVRGHIAVAELSTPLSTQHFSNYNEGEIYGLEHSPKRFQSMRLRARTHIPGLFMTGQDTVCVGIGSVLFSGIITAIAILNKNLLYRINSYAKKQKQTQQAVI